MIIPNIERKPEIERKFLLSDLPRVIKDREYLKYSLIHQSYFETKSEDFSLRIRHELVRFDRTDLIPPPKDYLTFKSGIVDRLESEIQIDGKTADILYKALPHRDITKMRYVMAKHPLEIVVDAFYENNATPARNEIMIKPYLYLAEIEKKANVEWGEIPDYIKEVLIREVTDEPEYLNVNLAK